MTKCLAVIALGSNLGQSTATLTRAAERVAGVPGIELLALSSIYTSKPAIVLDQPDFKNAVMLIETSLAPLELLEALQEIEYEFGRVREGADYIPKGPRTLDLDVIDYEGIVSDDPVLTLPHPEALHRDFVVTPLLEISPHYVLANQKVVNHSAVDCGEVIIEGSEKDSSSKGQEEREGSDEEVEGACLFLCATPIGNLGDITLRVLDTLRLVDIIYCEDTRVTRKLAFRYDISTPLRRCDAPSLSRVLPQILARLEEGKRLAYVSDAGMPGISDPGGLLVATVREAGYVVEVLPGASALTTALAACGIKAHNHYFGGFFPRKTGAATRLLENVSCLDDTVLVFFESVHRIAKTMDLIASCLPSRKVVVARELTKLHEELLRGTAEEVATAIAQRLASGHPLKGEIVLLIAPSS